MTTQKKCKTNINRTKLIMTTQYMILNPSKGEKESETTIWDIYHHDASPKAENNSIR